MLFWTGVALLTAAAMLGLLWPLIRSPGGGGVGGGDGGDDRGQRLLDAGRSQLAELEAERQRGLIDKATADQTQNEIERRMLSAARETEAGAAASDADPAPRKGRSAGQIMLLCFVTLLPVAALPVYFGVGAPELALTPVAIMTPEALPPESESGQGTTPAPGPDQAAIAAVQAMDADARAAMIRDMVAGLAARLAEAPDDHAGWMRLGRSYDVLGETGDAVAAYAQAVRLRPDDMDTRLAYAQAIHTDDPAGPISARAAAAFGELARLDPEQPVALLMLGRVDAEAGRTEAALQRWTRLLERLPPESPAAEMLSRQIERLRADTAE